MVYLLELSSTSVKIGATSNDTSTTMDMDDELLCRPQVTTGTDLGMEESSRGLPSLVVRTDQLLTMSWNLPAVKMQLATNTTRYPL